MNEKEEFEEIARIFDKNRDVMDKIPNDEFCKLWEYILDKRHDLKEKNKQLESYENMRKEAIEFIKKYCIDDEFYINLTHKEKSMIEVLNILNRVDEDNE